MLLDYTPPSWHVMVQPVDVLRGSGKRAVSFPGKKLRCDNIVLY